MARKGEKLYTATGTYTVVKSLGSGGAGEVYLVNDESGIGFAAKALRAGLSTQKLKRFQNELMFGIKEDHPNLIKVLDFGRSDDGAPFYIMPLADSTLRAMMKAGIVDERKMHLFAGVLDGVEAAHLKGVFHRDLKPENVLYFESGQRLSVADFGIAHFEEEHLHTAVETLASERLANFEYAAPEQRRPGAEVNGRADIFALGSMLSELFTGEVPHGVGAAKVSDKAPSFAYLDDVIEKMRQQDPAKRHASIREVKAELSARGNSFIEAQKVDRLRHVVVRDSDVTDPLVLSPPTLIDVNFTGSALEFKLSQSVTNDWISTFHNAPLGGLVGYEPGRHVFRGTTVTIQVTERLAQQIIDQFKFYLQQVNDLYSHAVKERERQRVNKEKRLLAAELERQEQLVAAQKKLKW